MLQLHVVATCTATCRGTHAVGTCCSHMQGDMCTATCRGTHAAATCRGTHAVGTCCSHMQGDTCCSYML